VDLYWDTTAGGAGIAYARLIPCDDAAFESSSAGVYLISVNGKVSWDPNADDLVGSYGNDSTTNRYINVNNGNGNYQMRFILDRWHLGKIENNAFVTYYVLQYTTGGIPLDILNTFNDYSDYVISPDYTWNQNAVPVTCRSAPVGQWTSIGYAGTGVAVTIRDPIPTAWNEGNTC